MRQLVVIVVIFTVANLPAGSWADANRDNVNAARRSIFRGDNATALAKTKVLLQYSDTAKVLYSYTLGIEGLRDQYEQALADLDVRQQTRVRKIVHIDAPYTQPRLPDDEMAQSEQERVAFAEYNAATRKSAWFAGVSSLLLPGSGYAYLGMWATASISALLTGLCIGSAVELYRHDLPASGTGVAMLGSVFYIGGALGAARSANDMNQKNTAQIRSQLRSILLPELTLEL